MHRRFLATFLFALAACAGVLAVRPRPVDANEGTMRSRCGQSLYVAAWVPRVVVHPGAGMGITLPVGLAPWAEFGTQSACGDPTATSLEVRATCEPSDGGSEVLIGPASVPLQVPTLPGAQSTYTGAGGSAEKGGVFDFMIPADVLREDVSWKVRVDVHYDVVFGSGIGAGTVSADTSTVGTVLPPSPLDASFPVFGMSALSGADGVQQIRNGDQLTSWFLLENNHPTETMRIELTASAHQVARMPSATAMDAPLFSISAPQTGDDPAVGFADDLTFDEMLDLIDDALDDIPDPTKVVVLMPEELRIVGVTTRADGDQSVGSAHQIELRADVTLSNTEISSYVDTAAVFRDVPGRSPLYENQVDMNVGPLWTADFTPVRGEFGLTSRLVRNFFEPGNNPDPDVQGYTNRKAGALYGDILTFGAEGQDMLRTEEPLEYVSIDTVYRKFPNSTLHENQLRIDVSGVTLPYDVRVPVFAKAGAPFTRFRADVDLAHDSIRFFDINLTNGGLKYTLFHEGSFSDVVAGNDPAITVDTSSYVEFAGAPPPAAELGAQPDGDGLGIPYRTPELIPGVERDILFGYPDGALSGGSLHADAQLAGVVASLEQESATQSKVTLTVQDPAAVPAAPRTAVTQVDIKDDSGTIVLGIPIALRSRSDAAPDPLPFDSFDPSLKFLFRGKSSLGRDSADLIVTVTPSLTAPEADKRRRIDFPTSLRDVLFELGGLSRRVALDAKGRYRSRDHRLSCKGRLRKDGTLKLTCKLKKSNLRGPLAGRGFVDATVAKPGIELSVPLRLSVGANVYAGQAPVRWIAKAGKSGVAKPPKSR